MKKTLKSQLLVAVVMLVIATVALTSASYAWFTAIANPQVSTIDLYVKAADTIMLSAYDNSTTPDINLSADWKASVSQTDITNPGWVAGDKWGAQATAFPTELLNVSSLANATSSDFYTSNYSALGAITGYSLTSQVGHYSKFSLWAKSTRDGYVFLDTTSAVTGLTATEPGNSIKKTVRIAFVPVSSGTENWAGAVIWEPNSKAHLAAIYGGNGAVVKSATDAIKGTGLTDTDAQLTYDFNAGDTNVLADDSYSAVKTSSVAGKIALFNITKDTATNFNVYIWVEGADVDTLNAVAKNSFESFLKFGEVFDKTIS